MSIQTVDLIPEVSNAMLKLLQRIVLGRSVVLGIGAQSVAADYFVYYGYGGTVMHFANPSAIAIKYRYDDISPLKSSLTKFFDGPTEAEALETGAHSVFDCTNGSVPYRCYASEIFESVRIEGRIAHINLSGVPSAPTSSQWDAFTIPFNLTVTQFPNVDGYQLYVQNRVVTGLDWGFECQKRLCFRIPSSEADLDEMIEGQF